MRRRESGGPDAPPGRLLDFDPADWPGSSDWERFRGWCAARVTWVDGHGGWMVDQDLVDVLSGDVDAGFRHFHGVTREQSRRRRMPSQWWCPQ